MSAIAWMAQPPAVRREWLSKPSPKVGRPPKATRAERVAKLVELRGTVTVEDVMHHMMLDHRREARRVMYEAVDFGGCKMVKACFNASPVLERL